MIGVDEAGKGAVVGSMFVSAVDFDDVDFGVPDSKRITPSEREGLAERIRNSCTVAITEVTAEEVDEYVSEGRMNDLMVEAHGRALEKLDSTGEAIADASDVSAERFTRRVSERVGDQYEIESEHQADETHDCVGAASVLAKVERDSHIADYDAGSGYPGDGDTVDFLHRHAPDYPPSVRESWSTSERILKKKRQSGLGDFDLGDR